MKYFQYLKKISAFSYTIRDNQKTYYGLVIYSNIIKSYSKVHKNRKAEFMFHPFPMNNKTVINLRKMIL